MSTGTLRRHYQARDVEAPEGATPPRPGSKAALQAELRERGLDTSGTKAELQARLDEAKADTPPHDPPAEQPEDEPDGDPADESQDGPTVTAQEFNVGH